MIFLWTILGLEIFSIADAAEVSIYRATAAQNSRNELNRTAVNGTASPIKNHAATEPRVITFARPAL